MSAITETKNARPRGGGLGRGSLWRHLIIKNFWAQRNWQLYTLKRARIFFFCSALESSDNAKMPDCRCVVQDCSNKSNPRAGISFHRPKSSQEVAKWKAFVGIHRANFNPKGLFKICSIHFAADCFERQVHIEGQPRNLVLGAIPTIWKKSVEGNSTCVTARGRRQVSALLIFDP